MLKINYTKKELKEWLRNNVVEKTGKIMPNSCTISFWKNHENEKKSLLKWSNSLINNPSTSIRIKFILRIFSQDNYLMYTKQLPSSRKEIMIWINKNLINKNKKISCVACRDFWWEKRNIIDIKNKIIKLTSFLPKSTKLGLRIFCIVKNIKNRPKCSCGKNVIFFHNQFLSHCSIQCQGKDLEIRKKRKKTCIEKYGVENPMQNKEIQEKIKKTCIEKYGVENYFKHEDFIEKRKRTSIEKYGVSHHTQSAEVQEKKRNKYLLEYGVTHPTQVHISDSTLKKLNNPEWLKNQNQNLKKSCTKIARELGDVSNSLICSYFRKFNIPITSYGFTDEGRKKLLEKYGVEYPTQSEEIKKKNKNKVSAKIWGGAPLTASYFRFHLKKIK